MHVHVNAAMSLDGKLASRHREQVAISGTEDFARVDRLRSEVDAVMVGVGTVLADDPSLTTPIGDRQPARVIVDTHGRTPLDARVLNTDAMTYLLVGGALADDRRTSIEATGATVISTPGTSHVDIGAGLSSLEQEGVDRLLVEGGGELLFSLFEGALVDTLTVFISPHIIGGRDAPTLVDGDGFTDQFTQLDLVTIEQLDTGLLCRFDVVGWSDSPAAVSSSDR